MALSFLPPTFNSRLSDNASQELILKVECFEDKVVFADQDSLQGFPKQI